MLKLSKMQHQDTKQSQAKKAHFQGTKGYMRDDYIKELLGSSNINLYPPLQVLPGDNCVQRGRYIEFETRGHGTFGWINRGVDTKTGDLIAIKELRIKNRLERKEVGEEVEIGRRFQVSLVSFQLHSRLTSHSKNGVFFQFWRHGANMAMPTVVQTGKSTIWFYHMGCRTSPSNSGLAGIFREGPSCNY